MTRRMLLAVAMAPLFAAKASAAVEDVSADGLCQFRGEFRFPRTSFHESDAGIRLLTERIEGRMPRRDGYYRSFAVAWRVESAELIATANMLYASV